MSFRALDTLVDAHQSVTTMVFHDGELVHQNLSTNTDRPWRVYSITKSVVSLITGIAQSQGLLSLADPASVYVPALRGGLSDQVTIRHLLAMTSGREWSAALDDEMTSIASDQTTFALAVGQQNPPGTAWRYDNLAAQILEPVLTAATGDLIGYANEHLFEPLGLSDMPWQRDDAGNPLTYAGLTATGKQLGVIGHLVLNEGQHEGQQLVPADFLAEALRPGSDLNTAYGHLFWTNISGYMYDGGVAMANDPQSKPRMGQLAPTVPEDTVWAMGWGSQLMAIVPSRKMVAIRLGRRPRYPDEFTVEKFTATALAGLG